MRVTINNILLLTTGNMSLEIQNLSAVIFANQISQIQSTNKIDSNRISREQKFWRKNAKKYDAWIHRAFLDQYNVIESRLISCINLNDTVLDLGTGTGNIALHLAKRCKKIIGIDLVPEMIQIAHEKRLNSDINNVIFQSEDAYNLSFSESTFDKVVCVNALQTMKEPIKAVLEGKRVLKPGGEFISITYCYGDSSIFEQLKLLKWVFIYGIPRYWINFTHKGLASLFKKGGFEILEEEEVWKKPCIHLIRCKKK
jgi:ubiquinone/menaquinone biosynthesis C-methylase UbiE